MRLYRPYIPLEIKCRVLLRQLGEMWPGEVVAQWRGSHGILLDGLLGRLGALLGCPVSSLRLDHDPPLALRQRAYGRPPVIVYTPDANDPEFLVYRSAANHDIKTRVRGDGAQFSDLALIRRQKKRNRPPKEKKPWPKRPFPKKRSPLKTSSSARSAK